MTQRHGRSWGAVALLVAGACGDDPAGLAPPAIAASGIAANPHNVLSAVVTAGVLRAESVAVRYGLTGSPLDRETSAVPAVDGEAVIPMLGLLPQTGYTLRVVAYGRGSLVAGDALTFHTGPLPDDLPRYTASGADPSPGYVAFAAGRYAVVIDNSGRVVWYRRFPEGVGLNFQVQPNGKYYAHPPTPDPADREPWLELDLLGTVTRQFGCARGLPSRFHDLIVEPDGAYWLMCDETRVMDLSGVGGVADARVTGTVVQHVGPDGALRFEWNPFDHFAITDLDPASRTGQAVNWTHGNALTLDTDGNLLVSFRSLSELTKIDARTGAVLWRLGGTRNHYTVLGAPDPPFIRQHGLRVTGPGELLLLDNLGEPGGSRAERYVLDGAAHTARLVASYGSMPAVTANLGGTTQALAGGRALIAFGDGRRVEEYDAAGAVVWRIEGDPGYVFRAQRIGSLYRPGVPY